MKPIKFKPVAVVVAVVVIMGVMMAAAFSSRSNAAGDKKFEAKPALTVATVKPSEASLPIRLAANGNIVAWQEAVIGSESNGLRLADVKANVGDTVRAGQVLATFVGSPGTELEFAL